MLTLTQASLEKTSSIQNLERGASDLYKALLAGRDNGTLIIYLPYVTVTKFPLDMAATMERLDEYRTHNAQFCKRLLDFLTIMFTAQVGVIHAALPLNLVETATQSNMLLGSNNGLAGYGEKGRPTIVNHQELESYLGRYSGLMLYLKEMDESRYSKVCAVSSVIR